MLKDLRDRGSHSLNWFLNPVTEAEAPGYFSIIEKPMDLRKVDNNLRDKAYRDLHEFAADLRLVFTNAMRFNASESSVYIDAQKSLNIFNDIYKRACSELKTGYHDDASSVGSASAGKGGGEEGEEGGLKRWVLERAWP